ncbi:MAG: rod shape-determining protein MreC [Lachnospiraceae bacterium]|nr:rod shape-determining protein MreC [Lachnospiraceae bacterium]
MKNKDRFSIPPRYILFGLTVLCVLSCVLSVVKSDYTSSIRNATSYVITPLQKGLNSVAVWISDKVDNFETLKEVQAENERLKIRLETLMSENSTLNLDRNELEQLRMLYKLDQTYSYPKVAAQVIGKDSSNFFSTFTINKGQKDGIAVDMNVISGSGLVGIVTAVSENTATVRSIIDDFSNVSAMIAVTSDFCNVAGDLTLINDGKIHVENLPKESLVGDGYAVVTSHISSKYLPGILIGYTADIAIDANNLTKSGYVIPIVDFENIQYVFVITERKITE